MSRPGTSRPSSAPWRAKVREELVDYLLDFAYLGFFLVAFAWYRRLILAEYEIAYLHFGLPLVEAAVLAKIVMLGDLVPFGRGFQRRPLLVPTFLRSILFSGYVALFSLVERTLGGLLHGKGISAGLEEFAAKGSDELLGQCVLIFCAFVPFFAFKELEKVMGKHELRALFWRDGAPTWRGESIES